MSGRAVEALKKPMEVREGTKGRREMAEPDESVDQAVLDRVIRRVVQVAQPEKIILFGSAVHGRMGPHSDLDLLVVRAGVDALDLMGDIYLNLRGVGAAVDAIVASPDDLERYRDSHGMVIREALREGRVVHEAA